VLVDVGRLHDLSYVRDADEHVAIGALTRHRDIEVSGLVKAEAPLLALVAAWLWSAIGIGTLIFWAGLRAIGREYVEIALLEGAGPMRRLLHVLASLRPAPASAACP